MSDNGEVPPIGLPPDLEIWQADGKVSRPRADDNMFHGPLGDFARCSSAYSEADPAAVLAQSLALFGASIGRGPHMLAGNSRHPSALHILVIGKSAKAAKGTSWAIARELGIRAYPGMNGRIHGGFASGEAIIADLTGEADPGKPPDERLMIMDTEFASVLSRCKREGSILAATLRAIWDGTPLESRSRTNGRLVVETHHIGATAHITRDELRSMMSDIQIYAGTANRWLHIWCERGPLQ
jgi:hypothetical protein